VQDVGCGHAAEAAVIHAEAHGGTVEDACALGAEEDSFAAGWDLAEAFGEHARDVVFGADDQVGGFGQSLEIPRLLLEEHEGHLDGREGGEGCAQGGEGFIDGGVAAGSFTLLFTDARYLGWLSAVNVDCQDLDRMSGLASFCCE
jgi:hypothetical protein